MTLSTPSSYFAVSKWVFHLSVLSFWLYSSLNINNLSQFLKLCDLRITNIQVSEMAFLCLRYSGNAFSWESNKWVTNELSQRQNIWGSFIFTNEETKAQRNDISVLKYSDDVIRTNISLSVNSTEINVFEELSAAGFLSELLQNRNAWVGRAGPLLGSCCVRCPIYKIRKSVTKSGWVLSHIQRPLLQLIIWLFLQAILVSWWTFRGNVYERRFPMNTEICSEKVLREKCMCIMVLRELNDMWFERKFYLLNV